MGHTVSRNLGSIKKTVNMAMVLENSMSLTESLHQVKDLVDKKKLIHNYLTKTALSNVSNSPISDFLTEQEWMNTTEPLFLKNHLKNKIVIMDFFTYCCINCMHILPDLKEIEEKFPVEKGLVVVGVHYAKFTNEKLSSNIEAAVHRYEINHPVVNDEAGHMWNELGVHCWPTLVVLAPGAIPVLHLQGEGHKELLLIFVEVLMEILEQKKALSKLSIPEIKVTSSLIGLGPLKYPGKVSVLNNILAISDTGYHRIIIADQEGNVQHVIGGKQSGYKDGSFEEAKFHSPQGLTFKNETTLYVADTDNHTVREIDLQAKQVRTVAGNTNQGHDYTGGNIGTGQAISSPWDVCFGDSYNVLYIAMAGTHQIWGLFLNDTEWWKKKQYKAGTVVALVGSGREENKNNDYPQSAGLAQPSGLVYSPKHHCLYFADSESSAVRSVSVASGKVSGVVGGALNPRNLFAYGDEDDIGLEAKLQHPLAVTWSTKRDRVYVADSYNHKIKEIEPEKRSCKTLPITVKLNEPGGIFSSEDCLYVADTNNHLIRKVHLDTLAVDIINIKIPASSIPPSLSSPLTASKLNLSQTVDASYTIPPTGGKLDFTLKLNLPSKAHVSTDGAPSKWSIDVPDNVKCLTDVNRGKEFECEKNVRLEFPPRESHDEKQSVSVKTTCKVYVCTDTACIPKLVTFNVNFRYGEKGETLSEKRRLVEYELKV
uniref:NHL repeat-containing protein 2 n=1 Tax=Cacopsylla melanoneura TaxID=428564 RepID=A0A8D8Y742_9HEMI